MRRGLLAAITIATALVAVSCNKDASSRFNGSYTYKTSGTVTVHMTEFLGLEDEKLEDLRKIGLDTDPKTLCLCTEQGQMHIVTDKQDRTRATVTFNDIFGDVCVADAIIDGTHITLNPASPRTAGISDGTIKIASGLVNWKGEGEKLDDTLILKLEYEGDFSILGETFTILDSDIRCVAQYN